MIRHQNIRTEPGSMALACFAKGDQAFVNRILGEDRCASLGAGSHKINWMPLRQYLQTPQSFGHEKKCDGHRPPLQGEAAKNEDVVVEGRRSPEWPAFAFELGGVEDVIDAAPRREVERTANVP